MRRSLIIAGILLLLAGLLWPWITKGNWWCWIGNLPGDIRIEREGFRMYVPITTMLLLSAVLSGLMWLLRRF
ncbi:MAG TPA: DUF2905 domain-containing protein [Flavobacteriales bacterium]|nr:DUF2905 domain-containing protein [Flavobacteriales bacterium]